MVCVKDLLGEGHVTLVDQKGKQSRFEIQRPASPFLTVTTIQVIQTSFPDKRRNYRIPSCAISNDHFKGSASKNIFQNLSIIGEEGPQRQDWFNFFNNKKAIPGESALQHPSNISGSRTDHFKPKQNPLNGFGGRGPGGQNASSRIIKHTAVG